VFYLSKELLFLDARKLQQAGATAKTYRSKASLGYERFHIIGIITDGLKNVYRLANGLTYDQ